MKGCGDWGEIPNNWRKVNITPIFEKERKDDLGTFRTVRLTSLPETIMAYILLEYCPGYVTEKKVIGTVSIVD